jgi:CheY-like chemotaxis protein
MKKILIIEDDAIVSSVYKNLLESKGFAVAVATDGQTGYYQMTEFRPDAVLLDLMLPKMNGVEILRKIRAQRQFQGIPVLVFTNAYVPNMVDVARQAGANFVFSKSTLTSRQLLEAMCQCLEGFSTSHLPPIVGPSYQVPPPTVAVPGASQPQAAPPPATSGQAVGGFSGNTAFVVRPAPLPPPLPASPDAPAPAASAAPVSSQTPSPEPSPFVPAPAPAPPAAWQPAPFTAAAAPQVPAPVPQAAPTASAPDTVIVPLNPSPEDARMQHELRVEFLKSVDPTIMGLRHELSELIKATGDTDRSNVLGGLHRQLRSLATNAALAGFRPVADLCSAFEVLLGELAEKPKNLTQSTHRTVANTMDCLTELMVRRVEENVLETPPPSILVVDDEVLSRRAVTFALEKGHLKATAIESPQEALRLATSQRYDLIFLDVQMPGLNGFDLCTQIRAHAMNAATPVIFVTSQSDFTSRARSTLSGATDLIAKPFMFIELTVKAISTLLQNRIIRPASGTSVLHRRVA